MDQPFEDPTRKVDGEGVGNPQFEHRVLSDMENMKNLLLNLSEEVKQQGMLISRILSGMVVFSPSTPMRSSGNYNNFTFGNNTGRVVIGATEISPETSGSSTRSFTVTSTPINGSRLEANMEKLVQAVTIMSGAAGSSFPNSQHCADVKPFVDECQSGDNLIKREQLLNTEVVSGEGRDRLGFRSVSHTPGNVVEYASNQTQNVSQTERNDHHSRKSLLRHRNASVPEIKYACQYCPREFAFHHSVVLHMKSCLKKNTSGHERNELRELSSGITRRSNKAINCRYCARVFPTVHQARSHERIHTGDRPFTCPGCCAKFAHSGNMIKHIKNKHPFTNPYMCYSCKETFKTYVDVLSHRKSFGCQRSDAIPTDEEGDDDDSPIIKIPKRNVNVDDIKEEVSDEFNGRGTPNTESASECEDLEEVEKENEEKSVSGTPCLSAVSDEPLINPQL